MPNQNKTTEEDYLDNLLNSVLSGVDDGELKDDIFDDELENRMDFDDDFFQSIEKDWMDEKEQPKSEKEETGPEDIAKEMFEKYKEEDTGEYRDVPPESAGFQEKFGGAQQQEEKQEDAQAQEEMPSDSQDNIAEDDMIGLMDILGVEPDGDEEQKQEIEDLENEKSKRKKKEKRKKKFFGKKRREETPEDRNVDIALDLMEKSQEEAEEEEAAPVPEAAAPKIPAGDVRQKGEETESIDSLISDLGLGEGFGDIREDENMEPEENDGEDKKKKKEKKKKKKEKNTVKSAKAKKNKKPKKPKAAKKPKKERAPKEPDEVIPISLPFLLFFLSMGVLLVLGVVFGGNYYNYQTKVNRATTYYVDQNFGKAYDELYGLSMKKGDEYFFQQVQTVTYVYRNYEAYQNLAELGNYQDALDSLLNGVKMFDKYKDSAREEYNCFENLNTVLGWITAELNDVYGITESEAREINLLGKGEDYSYKVAEAASQVQGKESETNDSNN